jgi:hypothetical protein
MQVKEGKREKMEGRRERATSVIGKFNEEDLAE